MLIDRKMEIRRYFDYDGFDNFGPELTIETQYHIFKKDEGRFVEIHDNEMGEMEKRCLYGPLPDDYNPKWLHHDWKNNTPWFQAINKIYF
jgi:hypothetical protein